MIAQRQPNSYMIAMARKANLSRIEIYSGSDGKRRWRVVKGNGQRVITKPGRVLGIRLNEKDRKKIADAVDTVLADLAEESGDRRVKA